MAEEFKLQCSGAKKSTFVLNDPLYIFIAFLERTQKQTFLGAFQAKEIKFRRKNKLNDDA